METSQSAARPARSMLFVPGSRPDWIPIAAASGADAIIIDLDNAVAPSERPQARTNVQRFLESARGADSAMVFIRTSAAGTDEWSADLEAVLCPELTGVVLPMVKAPEDVTATDDLVTELEARNGISAGHTLIVPRPETASGIRLSYEIASSSPRVAYMGGGASPQGDTARAVGYRWTDSMYETLYIRSMVLLNVRAAGVPFPVTGLWGRPADFDGLRRYADQSRDLGYSGFMAIHPRQIPVINEIFSPTAAEITHWTEVIARLTEGHEHGVGALTMDGSLIDAAHLKTAQQGLALAQQLGLR